MPKINACYIVCNEADLVVDSIRSVKPYVDRFVVVDSVFQTNPINATHSTDNTRKVIEAVCSAYPAVPLDYVESNERLTQVQARNWGLVMIRPDDWAFVVDGDEILYGQHDQTMALFDLIRAGEPPEGAQAINVRVFTQAVFAKKQAPQINEVEYGLLPTISTYGWMPRLFAVPSDLSYTGATNAETPILTFLDEWKQPKEYLWTPTNLEAFFLVNRHVSQSFESYQNDYVWQTADHPYVPEETEISDG